MIRSRGLPIALGAAAVLALCPPAWGYVRTTSNSGSPLRWNKRSLGATLYAAQTPRGLDRATFVRGARAAANTWGSTAQSCTDVQIGLVESDAAAPESGADGASTVAFVLADWPYDSTVLALTSVFSHGAVIFDADVELNGVDQVWGDVVADGLTDRQDVQNVLSHEFGHFLGLDHTCYTFDGRNRERPHDHLGQPVPDCEKASAEIHATTMFPSADTGDTSKRDLTSDDIHGVCDVYPQDSGGCALPRRPRAAGGGLLAAALVVLAAGLLRRSLARSGTGQLARGTRVARPRLRPGAQQLDAHVVHRELVAARGGRDLDLVIRGHVAVGLHGEPPAPRREPA